MKEESVIRLCRNYPSGTMSQEDKLYDSPSLSGKVLTTLEKGKNILLRGVLTKSGTKWYAIQWGGRFCFVPSRYCTLKQEPAVYRLASETVTEGVGGLEKHADWVKDFLPKYAEITQENVWDILKEEIGEVFVKVLEDAGVYKCTEEGRKAFERFINTL